MKNGDGERRQREMLLIFPPVVNVRAGEQPTGVNVRTGDSRQHRLIVYFFCFF